MCLVTVCQALYIKVGNKLELVELPLPATASNDIDLQLLLAELDLMLQPRHQLIFVLQQSQGCFESLVVDSATLMKSWIN